MYSLFQNIQMYLLFQNTEMYLLFQNIQMYSLFQIIQMYSLAGYNTTTVNQSNLGIKKKQIDLN